LNNLFKNSPLRKKTWIFPWKYKESFVIAFGLLLIGFLLELFSNGGGFYSPTWPNNLIILLSLVVYIIFTHFFVTHPLIKWLGSIPAAISAIIVFTTLILLMGFIPQNKENSITIINKIGLNHITQSFSYVIISFYLLIILGYTITKRLYPINLKNFAFFMNHAGLWVVLATGSLGAGDIVRLIMPIQEKQTSKYAYDNNNKLFQLPFSIELIDFSIDEYPPNIILAGIADGKIIANKDKQKLPEIIQGKTIKMKDWIVYISKYYEMSYISDSSYYFSSDSGAVPSAYIIATNVFTNQIKEGWISCGNYKFQKNYLIIDNKVFIGMLEPPAKKFSSKIKIYTSDKIEKIYTIEVNKPIRVEGWEIYQSSYDSAMGRWSTISVFEIVKDSWYKAVYFGIVMLLIGSIMLFWHGKYR